MKKRLLTIDGYILTNKQEKMICRLCGESDDNLIPIFENNYYIPEKISKCLPIMVNVILFIDCNVLYSINND